MLKALVKREPRVAFSDKKGRQFSPAQKVVLPDTIASKDDWLWRISWHKKVGYGTVYQVRKEDDWKLHLVKTKDGKTYEFITTFDIKGKPSALGIKFSLLDTKLFFV